MTTIAKRYEIERELGRGGMATVMLARDVVHDRFVALKLLRPELAGAVSHQRFLREMHLTARLQHPYIVPLYDSGVLDDVPFYVMPYVEGESLRARLNREKQLAVADAISIATEIASALEYAASSGIVHRDIKPENILLSGGQALLADFGIARAVIAAADDRLTSTGLAIGTPAYMSPEQASGTHDVDSRSDIYSLASVLFEMLAGIPPFVGATPQSVIARRLAADPPPLREFRPSVPEHVADAVARALQRVPADRFATAAEFAASLASPSHPRRFWRSLDRRRAGAATALLAALCVGVLAILLRARATPITDVNLVAVAPFDVLDPSLQLWHEGLVDVFSRNLDGAGPLRTIPTSVALHHWDGQSDAASAARLGHRTGAGLAVFGTLIPAGRDSVTLRVTCIDVATGRRRAEVDRRDVAQRVDRLADSVSVDLLRQLRIGGTVGSSARSSLGSPSLPAIKAFLQGEQQFRRHMYDTAEASYQRALAFDSDFALAYHQLALARIGELGGPDSLAQWYFVRAGALNRHLATRDSLLITADSLDAASATSPRATAIGLQRRRLGVLQRLVTAYPDDPEVWDALGDLQSVNGEQFGVPRSDALYSFARAVASDPSYAPAYFYVLGYSATLLADSATKRYAEAYEKYTSDSSRLVGRLVAALLDPVAGPKLLAPAGLDSISAYAIETTGYLLRRRRDSAELALQLGRLMVGGPREKDEVVTNRSETRDWFAHALAFRGHLREADRVADTTMRHPWEFQIAVALLDGRPSDSSTYRFRQALGSRDLAALVASAAWWSRSHDTKSLSEVRARCKTLASVQLPSSPDGPSPSYCAAVATAYLALARSDTAEALQQFAAAPDSDCSWTCWPDRVMRARLLAATGRPVDAAVVLDSRPLSQVPVTVGEVIWALERGRIAAQLGDRRRAIENLAFVRDAWQYPDPQLEPLAAEARRALAQERRLP